MSGLLVILLAIAAGCGVSSIEDPGQSVFGRITFVDSVGNHLGLIDGATVLVSSEGDSLREIPIRDSASFSLSELPPGKKYVLKATAPGFGSYTWSTPILEMGRSIDVGEATLIALPTYSAILDTVRSIDSTLYVNGFDANWSSGSTQHNFLAFCSLSVGSTSTFVPNSTAVQSTAFPTFSITIPIAALRTRGAVSGQRVYLTLRAVTPYESLAPLQSGEGINTYAAPGPPSNEVSFVMP